MNKNYSNKQKYKDIQNDEKLLDCYEKVYKTDNKKELGDKYKLQIGRYFQGLNFEVHYNGINSGKLDGRIDIIAWSPAQVLPTQSKNHKNEIKQESLRKFIGDCAIYENKHKDKIKNREIKRIFASNSAPYYGTDRFLSENKNILEFLKIKAECRS